MYKDEKFEARQNDYRKCKFNLLEQRERNHLTLRKQKIDEIIFQKRIKSNLNTDNTHNYAYSNCKNLLSLEAFDNLNTQLVKIFSSDIEKFITSFQKQIELIFQMLKSQDENRIFSIFLVRYYLSLNDINFDIFKNTEILDIIQDFLETETDSKIIYELYWILTNISYQGGYEENSILLNEKFIRLYSICLKEQINNFELLEEIIWMFRNIVCEHINLSVIFLKSPLIDHIIDVINYYLDTQINIINSCLSLFYDCLKHEKINQQDEKLIQTIYKLFPIFANLIVINDDDVFISCLWSLTIISGVEDPENPLQIQNMFMQNEGELINLLLAINYDKNKSDLVQTVRIFGNLLSVEDCKFIDNLLEFDILNFFRTIFKKEKSKRIIKETIWAISNITGGNYKHIKMIVDSDLFDVITKMTSDYDYNSRKEAVNTLFNMCGDISLSLSTELVKKGIFEVLINVIQNNTDISIIELALDSIDRILSTGEPLREIAGFNSMAKKFDEVGGCNCFEQLQKHPNQKIYEKTLAILEKYFETKEVDYDILASDSHLGNLNPILSMKLNVSTSDNSQYSNPNYNFFGPNGAVELQNDNFQNYPYQISSSITNYEYRI